MRYHKRRSAFLLLIVTVISMLPIAGSNAHTAEAAVWGSTCPQGGGATRIGDVGCSACGGSGRKYRDGEPENGANYGFVAGSGMNAYESFTKGGDTKVVEYYVCHNCGVVPKKSRHIKTEYYSRVQGGWKYVEGNDKPGPYFGSRASGYVPQRWCNECGPILKANGDVYIGREASYNVYHIEEETTKTYTIKVVASPSAGGTAGDGGTFDEGTTITLWEVSNEGYEFTGWSGATVTKDKHTVTKNVTITANFKKKDVPVTTTPVPVPTEVALPTRAPTPAPTSVPRPYPIQQPAPVPTRAPAPAPTPSAFSDVHADYCYEGTQHVCTQSSCYSPVYHSHSSFCLGPEYVSGYTPCTNSSCSNGYIQVTCTACSGSGTAKDNCPKCSGTSQIDCSSCGGTGDAAENCSTCGGDGKVSGGKCGGTVSDSRPHTVTSNGTTTCGSCHGAGKFTCSTCRGSGTVITSSPSGPITSRCGTCDGSRYTDCNNCTGGRCYIYYCISCKAEGTSITIYTCASCGATASSAGTCTKTLEDKACPNCTKGKVTVDCAICGGDGKVSCNNSGCSSGKITVDCFVCNGDKKVYDKCGTCGGVGELPVYSRDYICGYTTNSIVSWNHICGKENGAYYKNGIRMYAVCDEIVTKLSPFYPEQILEKGDTPDYRAYAAYISNPCECGSHSYPCVHGGQPVGEVTCTASGFNASLYNTWQTVTLSYGKYSDSAKNVKSKVTTIKVYVAADVTVTFDANGGTVSPASKTVVYGEKYGTLPVPVRQNYQFNGWIYNNAEVTGDSIVQESINHTLTAWWDSLERIVTFDPNGGTVSPTTKNVVYGKAYGELPTPARTGYTFDGWWYGREKITADSIVNCYGHPTLRAGWIPNEYTVTLHPNGGTVSSKTVRVRYDSTANNTIATDAAYPGYTLAGWYTAGEGGEKVYDAAGVWCAGEYDAEGNWHPSTYWKGDGGKWGCTGDITLYAHWSVNTYTITLNGMGATYLPQKSTTAVYLKPGKNVQVPTRTGYTFDGFYTEPKGVGIKIFNSAGYGMNPWTTPADGTVYANWIPITYTINVAAEEIRIKPAAITKSDTLDYDDTYTIPSARADKSFTVSYDLRGDTTGTSTPTVTLAADNTKACHSFTGWQLFRNVGADYDYIRRYNAGTTVQSLSSLQGDVLTLFPYWSGSDALVALPEPTCVGYRFLAWGLTKDETDPDRLLYLEEGGDNTYKPTGNDTLYAYWEPMEYTVRLDGRGATRQEQQAVSVTYDASVPDILPPEKTGYTFGGYYTGTRGTGTKYFDADGKGTGNWKEVTDILYACWVQRDVELPERGEEEAPEVLPEATQNIEVMSDGSVVHLYADDNDPTTGAFTDIQPYQVSDIVTDGVLEAAGAIPSTENLVLRAKMGAWMFAGTMERQSGAENVRIHVTVPYRTQYEDAEEESLIISERKTKTIAFLVPKTWSCWVFTEGGIYIPEKVVVENAALESGSVEVPVIWENKDTPQRPEYTLLTYGNSTDRFVWSTYDVDGVPSLSLTLTKEEYIISKVPGEPPDVTEHLTNVCHKAAWGDETELPAKSDNVFIAGIAVLSDTAAGVSPDAAALAQIRERIEETSYTQTYRSGISLLTTAKNGRYDTLATIIYRPEEGNIGSTEKKYITAARTNEINIHTPVVCYPEIVAEHEDRYQGDGIPEGSTVLVLDEEGVHSDFVLQIGNTGYHSDKKGYGTENYGKYLAQANGKIQNEVRFPFDVWIDAGKDREQTDDILLPAGQWYTLGSEKQRFYLPLGTENGSHQIQCRSVAVNGCGDENKTEPERNSQPANYAAESRIGVYVTGRLYDFAVYEVGGTESWKEAAKEAYYTIGAPAPDYDVWDTLPLRTGVHPWYRNVGGLPIGGFVKFLVKSTGSSFGTGAVLTVEPHFMRVTENGSQEAEVYFEEEIQDNVFLKKWNGEERAFVVKDGNGIGTDEKNAVTEWCGTFTVPDMLYVAENGTELAEYQKYYGLTFQEDFWIKDAAIILRFALRITNACGEVLYYGMLPDGIANNIWKAEAGASYREDNKGNRYEIQGGEVAVIYPGESAKKDYVTNGIY